MVLCHWHGRTSAEDLIISGRWRVEWDILDKSAKLIRNHMNYCYLVIATVMVMVLLMVMVMVMVMVMAMVMVMVLGMVMGKVMGMAMVMVMLKKNHFYKAYKMNSDFGNM